MFYKKITSSQIILFLPSLVLAVLGTAFAMYGLLSPDVSYFLEFSERILEGKRLYQDLVDNQFPTIYLISLLVVLFSKISGISVPDAFFLLSFLLLNGCIFLSWKILKENVLFQKRTHQMLILFLLYYVLFILPHDINGWEWSSFGQREHFFCALIFPYLTIILSRLQKWRVNQLLAITSGILAGIGFSIKPHFLVIFIASELFIMWHTKTILSWLRLESSIIFSVLLFCFLSMVFITPNYLKTAPYYVELLQAISQPWPTVFLICLSLSLIPLLVLLWFLIEKKLRVVWYFSPFFFVLSIAAIVTFALGVHVANYHKLPFQLITLLWIGLMVCMHPKKTFSIIFFSALTVVLILRGIQQFPIAQERRDFNFKLVSKLKQYAPNGGVVAPLDTVWAYPSITYAGARRGLGIAYLWYIPSVYDTYRQKEMPPPYHFPNQMGETERFFHEHVIHNLETDPPQLIILNKAVRKGWLGHMQFDFIDYFSQDPRFVKLWGNYRLVSHLSDPVFGFKFELYQRQQGN